MEHLAIDIGGRESQVCVRAPDGTILQEMRLRTRDLPTYLAQRPPSRVIVESCAESFYLADAALAAGHEARVVAATLVKSLGVGARKTKTDKRDARVMSEASCRIDLPSVHIPSPQARSRKSMLSMRQALVASRTMIVNTVRGWLRAQAVRCRKGAVETFPERVREALESNSLPTYVERQLTTIESLTEQIRDADRELAVEAKHDARCPRLMSVPGVGSVTAVAFCATLDTIERFETAHHVQAYLGLTPGESSSSDGKHRLSITKAGSTRVRWLLVQAAWSARRTAPDDPMVQWSLRVQARRGKHVAIVALARKLAGILFALWRDGTFYNPKDGAKAVDD